MKIAYLILAHKYPRQLSRLIQRLDSPGSWFFVHIDKKADFSVFREALKAVSAARVQFVKREDGGWGEVGVVKAVLHGLRDIWKHTVQFDYVISLTGQCYPVKNVADIHKFFEENNGKNYIHYFPMPGKWSPREMDRIERYHFHYKHKRVFPPYETPRTIASKVFHAGLGVLFPLPRVFPRYVRPYGGSAFLNLTRDAMRYILDFVEEHPDYLKFHVHSLCSDEIFFQSILLSSSNERILGSLVGDDLRYTFWETRFAAHPAILREKDFKAIIGSGKLFARKFDPTIDSAILDMLDQQAEVNGGRECR